MNSRHLNGSNCIRSPQPSPGLQDNRIGMDQSAAYSIRLRPPAGRLLSVWRDVMGTIKVTARDSEIANAHIHVLPKLD
jgi:hypothetical protein